MTQNWLATFSGLHLNRYLLVFGVACGLFCYDIVRHRADTRRATSAPLPLGSSLPPLEIKSVRMHGHISQLRGTAESGSTVIINADKVPVVDGQFAYFAGPLPDGVTIFTVTAQTEDGRFSTQQVLVSVN